MSQRQPGVIVQPTAHKTPGSGMCFQLFPSWTCLLSKTRQQAAGEPRHSSEPHSMCNSHHPASPHGCVWANKVCRNLSQSRVTIIQGKQHLNILAGLVRVVPALPAGFSSVIGKGPQRVMLNSGTSRTILTKRCLRAHGTRAAHRRGTCKTSCSQTMISLTGSIPGSL